MDFLPKRVSEFGCQAMKIWGIEMNDRGNRGLTDARTWGRRGIALASLGLLSLALLACGGGSGGPSVGSPSGSGDDGTAATTGIFVDSPVEGLRYVTDSLEGQTDAGGRFDYRAGETVEFYVGDIPIGATTGALELSPIDLVPGATNENHPTVTNIARFLQTIDEDGNPSNGIRITEVVANLARGESVNFNQSISDFENDGAVQVIVSTLTSATSAGARSLVPASVAQDHLRSSLLGLLEGRWVGTVVYEAVTAPYTGDQCEWRVEGQMSDSGIFTFSNTLRSATGIGSGFCISSTGAGQWQRSGNQVEFTITTSSASLIGNITRHTGEVLDEGRKLSVSGQGVEQGVTFTVSINASKI